MSGALSLLTIDQNLIPIPDEDKAPFEGGSWSFVLAHSTANTRDTVQGEDSYEHNTWQSAFVHFFVGANRIIQEALLTYQGWGAGPVADKYAVHIEACEGESFPQVYGNYVALIAALLYDAGKQVVDNVTLRGHFQTSAEWHETDHTDPLAWLQTNMGTQTKEEAWAKFVSDVQNKWNEFRSIFDAQSQPSTPAPQPTPQPAPQLFKVFAGGVQKGAYSVEKNAYDAGWQLYNAGNKDAYLTTPSGDRYSFDAHQSDNPNKPVPTPAPAPEPQPTPTPQPTPQPEEPKNPIKGQSVATVDQMVAFVKPQNANFDPAIAQAFLDKGKQYVIRGDVAFCQSIHETNWFTFKRPDGTPSKVRPEQHNYAGIGVLSNDVSGNAFATITDGVTAQMQHLYIYSGLISANVFGNDQLLDPRYQLVSGGICPNWEDLAGHWAKPGYDNTKYSALDEAYKAGETYGQSIIKLYNELLNVKATAPAPAPEPIPYPIVSIDPLTGNVAVNGTISGNSIATQAENTIEKALQTENNNIPLDDKTKNIIQIVVDFVIKLFKALIGK